MIYQVTSLEIGTGSSPKKLKEDALKGIRKTFAAKGGNPEAITLDNIKLHRVVLKPISQNESGVEFEVFEALDNKRLHKKVFNSAEEMRVFLAETMREVKEIKVI